MNQSKLLANTFICNRHKARENVCKRVTIGFGFTSDWMTKGRVSFKAITKRSNARAKLKQLGTPSIDKAIYKLEVT